MSLVIVLSVIAVICMFVCILKFPIIKIGKHRFDTFYIPLVIVALILLTFPTFNKTELFDIITSNSALNPLKILGLFICVSILSILLDEAGFFSYIATVFINKYKSSQFKLFFILIRKLYLTGN